MKENRYKIDPKTGCWNWQLHVTKYGYGWVNASGQTMHAHRHEFIKRNGSIPDDMFVHHKCRNRRCVNPDHLELATNVQNIREGNTSKLNVDSVADIRKRYAEGIARQVDLAREHGVHPTVISKIVNGYAWVEEVDAPILTKRKKHSRFRGVSWSKAAGKWVAFVSVNRKYKYLGLFVLEEEAAIAYNDAVDQYGLTIPKNRTLLESCRGESQ